MQLKHIYWFGYYNTSVPSVRYRALMPLMQLTETHGVEHDFVYPSYRLKSVLHFFSVYISALLFRRSNSIIVFQKIHTQGVYARLLKYLLKKQPCKTVYDIDDAEYTRRPVATIHHFMTHCSCCTVGSVALKIYAEQFNQNVYLLSSPVKMHDHLKQKRNAIFTIGWIGYFGAHYASFEAYILPIISKISFPIQLVILGITDAAEHRLLSAQFETHKHVTIIAPENINWMNEDEIYSQVANFDVGIAPLVDTEFNRAKSAYKMKQYLSCGVPVLASGVGENNTFLQNGENGFICDSADDFLDKIEYINQLNDNNYNSLSKNARLGFATFSMEKYCKEWINVANTL